MPSKRAYQCKQKRIINGARLLTALTACWVLLIGSNLPGQSKKNYIYVNGRLVAVEESCLITLSPISADVPVEGTSSDRTIQVTCAAGCAWTAVSNNNPWLTVTGGHSGSGTGVVSYRVSPNSGGARIGTITIAGLTVTVNQAGWLILIGTTPYGTLQAAYNAATEGATIQCVQVRFTENLLVNRNVSVTLQGGYDPGFSATNGNMSEIKGIITTTAGGGTLTIRNFMLVSQ